MKNRFNLLYNPEATWQEIAEKEASVTQIYVNMVLVMAAIPPVSAFIGAVYSGWRIGAGEVVKLTFHSGLQLSVGAYIAILIGLYLLARLIKWMAGTYGANPALNKCFALGAYSCMPLFLASIVSVYPLLWLDLLITLVAMAFGIRLLYTGTSILMGISKERGFMFATSILTVGGVLTIGALSLTLIFWSSGLAPVFTR